MSTNNSNVRIAMPDGMESLPDRNIRVHVPGWTFAILHMMNEMEAPRQGFAAYISDLLTSETQKFWRNAINKETLNEA